ncbi:hypothetical protein ebA7265 [Aromatoleum aromaticum EbN1]|uniref:Uncharacterized protein n=1 Tax=Aromatoleum aromaticum (strain DSM 19018 / LMG 30748 / EbN1) TaxID=76114 RepID=Q5NXH4_AROAE|nr:hypothetical protein ebA7265 [Aromatoleum aromaticum EbN1]
MTVSMAPSRFGTIAVGRVDEVGEWRSISGRMPGRQSQLGGRGGGEVAVEQAEHSSEAASNRSDVVMADAHRVENEHGADQGDEDVEGVLAGFPAGGVGEAGAVAEGCERGEELVHHRPHHRRAIARAHAAHNAPCAAARSSTMPRWSRAATDPF